MLGFASQHFPYIHDDPSGRHSAENPGAGDRWCLEQSASVLAARAADWARAQQVVGAASARLSPVRWTGQAASGWHERMRTRHHELGALAQRAADGEQAIRTYLQQVQDIASRAHTLRGILNSARQSLWQLRSGSPFVARGMVCEPGHPFLVAAECEAREQEQQALRALRDLHTERMEADSALVALLDAHAGSSAARKSFEVLTARGYTGADLTSIDPHDVADVMADLARDVIATDGANGQIAEDFRAMAEAWGGDEAVVGALVASTGLGLAGLARALDVLGHSTHPDGTAAYDASRRAVDRLCATAARVTHDWDDNEIKAQVEAIVAVASTPGGDSTGVATGIGYLFGDPHHHPMGAAITFALATELDRLERQTGAPWLGTQPASGLRDLGGHRVDDPLARMLSTMGVYSDEAREWVTDPPDGPARLDYYFRERDSSINATGDGFEGVAGLWAGLQHGTGGLLDLDSPLNTTVQAEIADLDTKVISHLADNRAFLAENVSTLGSIELATGIAQILPQLGEVPLIRDPGDAEGSTASVVPGLGVISTPTPSYAAVTKLLGTAAYDPAGQLLLDHAITTQNDQIMQFALGGYVNGEGGPLISFDRAVDRAGVLYAAAEGARHSIDESVAARHDEIVQARLDLATSAVGALPGPSAYLARAGLDTVTTNLIDAGASIALDAGSNHLSGIIPHAEAQAIATNTAERDQGLAAYRAQLEHYVPLAIDRGLLTDSDLSDATDAQIQDALEIESNRRIREKVRSMTPQEEAHFMATYRLNEYIDTKVSRTRDAHSSASDNATR